MSSKGWVFHEKHKGIPKQMLPMMSLAMVLVFGGLTATSCTRHLLRLGFVNFGEHRFHGLSAFGHQLLALLKCFFPVAMRNRIQDVLIQLDGFELFLKNQGEMFENLTVGHV